MPPEGRHSKGSAGPTIGIIIIVILLVFGALYFWGAKLNQKDAEPLPLIPGDSTSTY
jgi:hypothetical protein